jgi:hypothetical protein
VDSKTAFENACFLAYAEEKIPCIQCVAGNLLHGHQVKNQGN